MGKIIEKKLPTICMQCPLRITNDNPHCKNIGNPLGKAFIVFPHLQKSDKGVLSNNIGVKSITEIYSNIFGRNIEDDYLITSLIRCAPYEDGFNEVVTRCCFTLLYRGVKMYEPRFMILLGNASARLIGQNPSKDDIVYYYNGIYYFLNYNPLSLLYDNTKLLFKVKLIKCLNAIDNNNLEGFKLITL
jgi:hypothetical protein